MTHDKVTVHHWRYEDGWRELPVFLRKADNCSRVFDEHIVGWHCWVYSDNNRNFEKWMKENMKGDYEAVHRFNSGNPMFTVFIRDEEDAALFKLTWL